MVFNDLELIAIHIQKTAGMSFKKILKREYKRKYYRLNIGAEVKDRQAAFQQHLPRIPGDTRVIHGHYYYQDIIEIVNSYPDVPVVTWLRAPVQRVISSYYFFKRKFDEGFRENLTLLGEFSLLEFAAHQVSRNVMSRVLQGVDLSDLAFVGFLEYLEEDVIYLSKLLGWRSRSLPERNINYEFKSQFPSPTMEELEEIRRLNQADLELYNYALEIRERRVLQDS
ncbi:MAG: sulfotransferase family 2 domain-containing protein [Chloroflexota bacterium]